MRLIFLLLICITLQGKTVAELGTKGNPYLSSKDIPSSVYFKDNRAVSEVESRLKSMDKSFTGLNSIDKALIKKEGFVDAYYLDSLGILTRGVGQTQTYLDGPTSLSGFAQARQDTRKVTDEQVGILSREYKKLGLGDVTQQLNDGLYKVNYQVGGGWIKKFPSAWGSLKAGEYDKAIKEINFANPTKLPGVRSNWYKQTKNRVIDFEKSILAQKDYRDKQISTIVASNKKLPITEDNNVSIFKKLGKLLHGG